MANGLLKQFESIRPGETIQGLIDPTWPGLVKGSGPMDPNAVQPLLWSSGARLAASAPGFVSRGSKEIITGVEDAVNLGRTLVRKFPYVKRILGDVLKGKALEEQLKKVTDQIKGREYPHDVGVEEEDYGEFLGPDQFGKVAAAEKEEQALKKDEERLDTQLRAQGFDPEDIVSAALKRITKQEGDITLSPDRFYPGDTTPIYVLHEDYRVTSLDNGHKTKYWPIENPASLIREWELLDNASARNRVDKYLNLLFNVGDQAVIKEWELETTGGAWLDRPLPSESKDEIRRSINRAIKHGTGEADLFIELSRKILNQAVLDIENGSIERAIENIKTMDSDIREAMSQDPRMPPTDEETGQTFHPLIERTINDGSLRTWGDLMNLHVRLGQYNTIEDVVRDHRRQSEEFSLVALELDKVRNLIEASYPTEYAGVDRSLMKTRERILDYTPFPGMDEKNVLPTIDQLVDIFPPDEVGTVEAGKIWNEIPGKGPLSKEDVNYLDRTKELSSKGYDWLMEKVRAQEASQEEVDLLMSLMTMEELPED